MSKIMHKDITELKEFLQQYGLDFCTGEGCNDPLTWIGELLIEGKEPSKDFGAKVRSELSDRFKFKHIHYYVNDDYEHGFAVIEIKGTLYKLEVELSSGEGISSYTDFWAWTSTKTSTKTINVYE
jgi:hypothetical protein